MSCKICGADGFYNSRVKMVVCPMCAATLPDKMTRAEFDVAYWGSNVITVKKSIRDEFYDDYRASTLTIEEYIKQTVRDDSPHITQGNW